MRRTLLFLPAALLALAGCGDTCSSDPAELGAVATCTVRPSSVVQLEVQPACQRCGESSPSCGSELVGGVIELTPVYQTCQGDTSCPAVSCGTRFVCNVTTPAASGLVTVQFPTANGGVGQTQLNLAASGGTSCSL